MIKQWLKSVRALTWIRIWAAASLAFLVSWLFFNVQIIIPEMLIPFAYEFNAQRNIAGLLVPLLLNIALWVPNQKSYLFIRVVLCAELIRLTYIALIIAPIFSFLLISWAILLVLPLPISFLVNKIMINSLKEDKNKIYFYAESLSEESIKWPIRKLTVLFLLLIAFILFIGKNIAVPTFSYHSIFPKNYAKVETYTIQHKELKYSQINPKDGKRYIVYHTTPQYNIAAASKLDKNGRMLLIRMRSYDDDGKDLFIFDTVTMKNTHILQIPIVEKGERTRSGYTFTNDSQYVVVGDERNKGYTIKFQVLNISTGKQDDRFTDPKNLSKLHLASRIKYVDDIAFDPSGQYFAVTMKSAGIIELCDYVRGELVYTDIHHNGINDVIWLDDSNFLVSYYDSYEPRIGNVMQYSIFANDAVESRKKERLSAEMSTKNLHSWDIANSYNEKYIATLAHEKRGNSTLDTLAIWNVKSEEKLLETQPTGVVKSVEFSPDGKRVIVFEELFDRSGKITLWDISTAKKERGILIAPLTTYNNTYKKYKVKLIDNGKKLLIIEKDVHIVSLE